MGAEGGSDGGEFSVEGLEEVGEVEGEEFGGEALHGLLLAGFGFGVAEKTTMMAAEGFVFEGDLAAGSAGG